MSFYTGTQTELMYAMPASATDVTSTGSKVLSGSTAANPAYQLPTGFFQQQSGGGAGKSMMIKGGGYFTNNASTSTVTFSLWFATTPGTAAGIQIGTTGAQTAGTTVVTDGIFHFEALLTGTSPGMGATASAVNAFGWVDFAGGNNAVATTWGTFPAAGNNFFSRAYFGAAQTAIAPVPSTTYFIEPYVNWATNAPTHCQLTNYYIFGLN